MISTLDPGPGGRLSFWLASWNIGKDHPLTGTGAGTFGRAHLEYQVSPRYYANEAHSSVAQAWAEMGLPGLLVWLGILALAAVALVKAWRNQGAGEEGNAGLVAGLGGGLTLLALHSAIDLDFSVPAVQALFWVALGTVSVLGAPVAVAATVETRARAPKGRKKKGKARSARSPALADFGARPRVTTKLALVGLAVLACLPVLSILSSRTASLAFSAGDWETALDKFDLAMDLNPFDPSPHLSLGLYLSQTARAATGDSPLDELALREIDTAMELDPRNPNIHLAKARVLSSGGDTGGAIEALERGIALAPYVPELHYQLACLYEAAGDNDRAYTVISDLLTWFDVFLKNNEAREKTVELQKSIYLLGARTGAAAGRVEQALDLVERVLALDPENPEALELRDSLRP